MLRPFLADNIGHNTAAGSPHSRGSRDAVVELLTTALVGNRRVIVDRQLGTWRSLASALAWGARGRGFKSRRPDLFSVKPFGRKVERLFSFRDKTYAVELVV
jgi:hypothetical protein